MFSSSFLFLTVTRLVSNLAFAKWCKKTKMTETLAHRYSSESTLWELSIGYQYDRVNLDGFQNIFASLSFG